MNVKKLIQEECFRDEALNMTHDLMTNTLDVSLVKEPIDATGRKLRVVDGKNPEWYSNLFNGYHNGKKSKHSRSLVRRKRLISALVKLSDGIYRNFFIYNIAVEEIAYRVFEGYYIEEECYHVPPMLQRENFMED